MKNYYTIKGLKQMSSEQIEVTATDGPNTCVCHVPVADANKFYVNGFIRVTVETVDIPEI
jgi:hypothetical protein